MELFESCADTKDDTSTPIAAALTQVCVPNDDVEGVIKACPKDKLDDLVFVQVGAHAAHARFLPRPVAEA